MIKLQLNNEMNEEIISSYQKDVERINEMINKRTGPGNDFLGWVDWPVNYVCARLQPACRLLRVCRRLYENFLRSGRMARHMVRRMGLGLLLVRLGAARYLRAQYPLVCAPPDSEASAWLQAASASAPSATGASQGQSAS